MAVLVAVIRVQHAVIGRLAPHPEREDHRQHGRHATTDEHIAAHRGFQERLWSSRSVEQVVGGRGHVGFQGE
jgi:hypothetical protein